MIKFNYRIFLFVLIGLLGIQLKGQVIVNESNNLELKHCFVGNDNGTIIDVQYKNKDVNNITLFVSLKNANQWHNLPEVDILNDGDVHISDAKFYNDNLYLSGNLHLSNKVNYVIKFNTKSLKWEFPFEFEIGDTITSLLSLKKRLVIGGSFSICNGNKFNNLVCSDEKDKLTELLTINDAGINGKVFTLAANTSGDTVYIGGKLSKIYNTDVTNLGLVSLISQNVVNLKTDSLYVSKISVVRNAIYYASYMENSDTIKKVTKINTSGSEVGLHIPLGIKKINNLGFIKGTFLINCIMADAKGQMFIIENDSFKELSKNFNNLYKVSFIGFANSDNYCVGEFRNLSTVSGTSLSNKFNSGKLILSIKNIPTLFFWDKNNNGTFDVSSDLPLPYLQIKNNLNRVFTNTNKNGVVQWLLPTELKNIVVEMDAYKNRKPLNNKFIVSIDTLKTGLLQIPVRFAMSNFNDVKIELTANSGPTRLIGKNESMLITISNEGERAEIIDVVLTFNPKMSDIKSNPPPDIINSGKFTWKNIKIDKNATNQINLSLNASSVDFTNNEVVNFTVYSNTSDDYSENNIDSVSQNLISNGVFDSRKFEISKYGVLSDSLIIGKNDGYLDYTIRFVNTSADTVNNVLLIDSIDVPLFVQKVQLLSASHGYSQYYYLSADNSKLILRYNFDNLLLVPNVSKNSEIANSSGFVNLRLFFDSSVGTNYVLRNTAWINMNNGNLEATNTVSALFATNSAGIQAAKQNMIVYPNPTRDIINIQLPKTMTIASGIIYDISGKKVDEFEMQTSTMSYYLSNKLEKGTYLLIVKADNSLFKQLILIY